MFHIDDPVSFLEVIRQWWGKDETTASAAMLRLCECAVDGSFAPAGFQKTTGERVDALDALEAARCALKGQAFNERWNANEFGLHPVAAHPIDPWAFLEDLLVSNADATRYREGVAPAPQPRGLFGAIADRFWPKPLALPPRRPDFDSFEQRIMEERSKKARDTFEKWAPSRLQHAKPPTPEKEDADALIMDSSPHIAIALASLPQEPPPAVTGTPGRPEKYISLVLTEFARQVETGRIEPSLVGQSRKLEKWFRATHPEKQAPTAKTIENRLRLAYREAQSKLGGVPPKL